MRRRRGITLLELLVAAMVTVFAVAGATAAYVSGINSERFLAASQESEAKRVRFEQEIRGLLQGTYVSPDQNDASSYFIGQASGTSSLDNTAADSLTFTTTGKGLNGNVLDTQDDFETLNQRFGPQGGLAEISLSTTAVGTPGQDKQGLFLREQRPSDGDPTQGGMESVLDADIKSIQFEFYNGSDWSPTWETTIPTTGSQEGTATDYGRRIPASVRVTYVLDSDPTESQHQFIVKLAYSDVTQENPVTPGGGTQ